MGNVFTLLQRPIESAAGSVSGIITGRKRKRDDDDFDSGDDLSSALELSMNTPKRKKLITTAQYIYKALYKEERNSDISVMALGKIWRLHKVYLCQSPYFASMFNGSWRETNQDFINIEIDDPKITLDSLSIVFGSLYLDEVEINPMGVVSILATASLFQLDGLLERCTEVMNETTNAETAVMYYDAACQYGVPAVEKITFNWLLVNLMSLYAKKTKWLRTVSVDLMHALISSPDLYVMPTEFSLYIILKYWVFLRLNPTYEFSDKPEDKTQPDDYFSKHKGKDAFLETREGSQFEKVFRALRLEHMLNHHLDLIMLLEEKILPQKWLSVPVIHNWSAMLRVDESLDKGPKECDEKTFAKNCVRCGRMLHEEGFFQKWRWNGFNFGLDLVLLLITDTRILSIKRHHRTENERLLSLQVKRKFLIKVTIASLNELRQIKHSQTTGIKSITLDKNYEQQLLVMDKDLVYPLLISVNLLVVTPNKEIETIESDQSILEGEPSTNNNDTSSSNENNNNCSTSNERSSSSCGSRCNTNNITSVVRDN